jgi:hypothetical protein
MLGGTTALADRLVDAGLFDRESHGYRIHDFLVFNDSKLEVEERRKAEAEKKRRQRAAGAGKAVRESRIEHDPRSGRFMSPQESRRESSSASRRESPGDSDDVSPGESRTVSPSTRPVPLRRESESRAPSAVPTRAREGPSGNGEEPRLTKAQLSSWAGFGPEWEGVKRALLAKGIGYAPAGSPDDDDTSQRGLLFQVLRDWPTKLPEWIAASKARTMRGVIEDVLAHYHEGREDVSFDEELSAGPSKGEAMESLGAITKRLTDLEL